MQLILDAPMLPDEFGQLLDFRWNRHDVDYLGLERFLVCQIWWAVDGDTAHTLLSFDGLE